MHFSYIFALEGDVGMLKKILFSLSDSKSEDQTSFTHGMKIWVEEVRREMGVTSFKRKRSLFVS